MWAYVAYSDGKKHKKTCLKRENLIPINGIKYKVDRNDGVYYEGVILAEEDSKRALKQLISNKKPRQLKNCFHEFPTRVNPQVEDLKKFPESDDSEKNWKKRLINLATKNIDFIKPLSPLLSENQLNRFQLSLVDEDQMSKSLDRNDNTIRTCNEQTSSAKPCNEREKSPTSVESEMPLTSIPNKRKRRFYGYTNIKRKQIKESMPALKKDQELKITDKPLNNETLNDQLSSKSLDSFSEISETYSESCIDEFQNESDSDDPAFRPRKRQRTPEMFPLLKKQAGKFEKKHPLISDSDTSSSSFDPKAWNNISESAKSMSPMMEVYEASKHISKNREIPKKGTRSKQTSRKSVDDENSMKYEILTKFKEYINSADNIPNLIKKILNSKQPTEQSKQVGETTKLRHLKKSKSSEKKGSKPYTIKSKEKQKNINQSGVGQNKNAEKSKDKSSKRNKFVQLCVTEVYSAVPYSETLKNIFEGNNVNEIVDVLDSSVINHIVSTAPLLHTTANVTVFNCDEIPREEYFNTGINHNIMKLRQEFNDIRHDLLSSLRENNKLLKQNYQGLKNTKQDESFKIKETIKNALPSKSLEEFVGLNALLEGSSAHREELKSVYRIIICGENCIRNCIRKIMTYTLTNAVESEYSGVGKKFRGVTKLNYSKTQTFRCLQDVLIEKFGLSSELKNLGGRVGQWLSNNTDRQGGRKAKIKDKQSY